MSDYQQVEQAIDQMTAGGQAGTLDVHIDPQTRVIAELTEVDQIGCAFRELRVQSQRLAGAAAERLREVSSRLTERLTYLLEPIGLIETDEDSAVVQLRSQPPARDENGAAYYELLVKRDGTLTLRRFNQPRGSVRQPIPAQVTREVFQRLVTDLSSAG